MAGRKPKPMDETLKQTLMQSFDSPSIQEFEEEHEVSEGLTERQQLILRGTLRGITQKALANLCGLTQGRISQELSVIKDHIREKGKFNDQDFILGKALTVYEEVEQSAFMVASQAEDFSDKLKALQLIIQSRDKHTKLLMDVGALQRASNKPTEVNVNVSPIQENWEKHKTMVADAILQTTLSELPAPEPPEDAEWEECEDS